MLQLNSLVGFGANAGLVPRVEFVTQLSITTNTNTYTYSSASLGTVETSRLVVVVVHTSNGLSADVIDSVTIGGNAATKHFSTGPGTNDVAIFSLAVPTGATATIVVNLNDSDSRNAIGIFALYDLTSHIPHDIDSTTGSGTLSRTLSVLSDGITIVGATGSAGDTHTPTGYVESYDADVEGSDGVIGGYSVETSTGSKLYSCTNVLAFGAVHWR